MGGLGVLRDAPCAEPVEDELGHHDPVGAGIDTGGGVGEQLVNGVDAQRQDAGTLIDFEGRNDAISGLLGGDGALVAIAEGLLKRMAIGSRGERSPRPNSRRRWKQCPSGAA